MTGSHRERGRKGRSRPGVGGGERVLLAAGLAVLVACSGGLRGGVTREAVAVPLVDRFAPESLDGRREPAPLAATEWRFDGAGGALAGWQGGPGISGLEVRDGRLVGVAGGPRPVVELLAETPLGGGDSLHAIEVRLRASAGSELYVVSLGEEGPPAAAIGGPGAPPGATAPLLPGDEIRTYSFPMARTWAVGPFARERIRRIVLRPTDEPGARFEIESVRLVFRREHLASIPSGIGWHGLGEVWRESLVTRPGEIARFPLELPGRPWLDLSLGTLAELPVRFRVTLRDRAGRERTLLRRTVTSADQWQFDPVALDEWAGEPVEVLLAAESAEEGALAFWGSPVVRNRGAGSAAASADAPQGVIVVIADTLRRDHLETWGYDRTTAPTLARLAEEGVVFADALSQAVWTKVSVPSILTSLYPSTHGIVDFTHRLPAAATTLAELFRAAGYATFMTSAIPFTGQLTNLHQGVEVLHESRSFEPPSKDQFMKSAREFVGRTEAWIEAHRDVPFLAILHVADPHSPYRPFAPYDALWTEPGEAQWFRQAEDLVRPGLPPGPRRTFLAPSAAELARAGVDADRFVRHEIGWYDGSIRAMDAELGRLLDRLEHLGLADRVVVAFLSDHGEEFLEHGGQFHGFNLYGPNTNVPLLLWGPRFLPRGVRIEPTVELVDLLPTLAELARIAPPERAQGASLLPLVRSGGEGPEIERWRGRPAFSERAMRSAGEELGETLPGSAIVEGRWKLIEFDPVPPGRARFELFDHDADPLDRHDLAREHPEVVERLADTLARWRSRVTARRLPAEDAGTVDADELARLRSLGYVN